jgi:hypothetical protein
VKYRAWAHGNPTPYRCEEVVDETSRTITYCGLQAEPRFTTPLAKITADNPQPRWYCVEHSRKHPRVSCFSREVRRIA